jgi:hypothetical protein
LKSSLTQVFAPASEIIFFCEEYSRRILSEIKNIGSQTKKNASQSGNSTQKPKFAEIAQVVAFSSKTNKSLSEKMHYTTKHWST